jgi:hypothetical protein
LVALSAWLLVSVGGFERDRVEGLAGVGSLGGILIGAIGLVSLLVPLRVLGVGSRQAGCLLTLVGIVALVLAASLLPKRPFQTELARPAVTTTPTSARPRTVDVDDVRITVSVLCEMAVEHRLKSPKSADFPYDLTRSVIKTAPDTFTISSYVDAQNPFGVEIRTRFVCVLRWNGGNPKESASFDIKELTFAE